MTNYVEKIAKGSITIFLLSIIASIVGYLLRLFLARNLSVSDFGLFFSVIYMTSLTVTLSPIVKLIWWSSGVSKVSWSVNSVSIFTINFPVGFCLLSIIS